MYLLLISISSKIVRSQLLTKYCHLLDDDAKLNSELYSENRAPLWEGVRPIVLVSPTRQQSPHPTQAILDPTSPGLALARPPHSIKRFSILCHTVTRPPGVGGWYLGGSILWRNQVLSYIVTLYYPASQYGAILRHNMVLSCVITTEMKAPDRGVDKIHRHQLSSKGCSNRHQNFHSKTRL